MQGGAHHANEETQVHNLWHEDSLLPVILWICNERFGFSFKSRLNYD